LRDRPIPTAGLAHVVVVAWPAEVLDALDPTVSAGLLQRRARAQTAVAPVCVGSPA
jgi:hypothetical protein